MKPLSISLAFIILLALGSCASNASVEPAPSLAEEPALVDDLPLEPAPSLAEKPALVDDRPLEKQFEEAIRANDGTRIEALVEAGLDVNVDLNRWSAVTLIAATGNHDLIPGIVAAGFDLEAQRSGSGRTPLHAAAESGDLELISALVEAGADLEGVDDTQQNTAVQYAFYFGRVEAVRLLISLGADLDYVDITGRNTADMAKRGGSSEAIALAEELGLTPTSDE